VTATPKKPRKVVVWAVVDAGANVVSSWDNAQLAHACADHPDMDWRVVRCEGVLRG
jgi:hypothetical protein